MDTEKASRSAGIIAAHRAMESARDPDKRICYDPYARGFLPAGFTVIGKTEIHEETALELFKGVVPGFHEFFIARTRYIDEYLQMLINEGLEQLVILGAGYDSRAYRFDGLKDRVKVFEVDHPGTQNVKKNKLKEMFQKLPEHVTYVPIDFQTENLQSGLNGNGYDSRLKTFFIWEGVTMYIDPEAVDDTLSFVADNSGKGSALVFDYTYADVVNGTSDRKEAVEWLRITEKYGEPLRFGVDDEQIEPFLAEKGFRNIVSVTWRYFSDNYFIGANMGRESTPILSLARAEIKS